MGTGLAEVQALPAEDAPEEEPRDLARLNPDRFRQLFRRLREESPEQTVEGCLWYLSINGIESAGRHMGAWVADGQRYFDVLLDPVLLPLEAALKATAAMKDLDAAFFSKFFRAAATRSSPVFIDRALALLPVIGDCSAFYLLRNLNRYADDSTRAHTRLKAVKPKSGSPIYKPLLERRLQSEDPRARSSALEAIWHVQTEETNAIFCAALADTHHRVIGAALVGLHLQGEQFAFEKMIQLSTHKEPLFRAAMAWALGFVKDPRTTPVLEMLGRDLTPVVRKRALKSLLALESEPESDEPLTLDQVTLEQVTLDPVILEPVTPEPVQAAQSDETIATLPKTAEEEPESPDELNLFGGFSSYK